MAQVLKHFKRIHINGEYGFRQFALIVLPDSEGDACVTLVRCKVNDVRREMVRWGAFNAAGLNLIEKLKAGKQILLDERSLVIRLS